MKANHRIRNRWAGVILIVLLGLLVPLGAHLWPEGERRGQAVQERGDDADGNSGGTPLRLAMATQSGLPGTDIVLPLYLTPPAGVELRSLTVEIEWVSKNIQFSRLEAGVATQSIGANIAGRITGTTRDANSIEHSTLQIDASVAEQNPKRGFPEGLIAYLMFHISTGAQPYSVELRPRLVGARPIGSPDITITQAEIREGKINVELPGLPPYVTCFFFGH